MADAIDPRTASLGTLSVCPVGHQQRAVAIDHQVRRFEAVGVVLRSRRELDFFQRGKAAAERFGSTAHHGATPLTKEQATELGGKLRLAVGDTPGGRAQSQIGQWRQCLGRTFVVQIRIAVIGSEETVVDTDF